MFINPIDKDKVAEAPSILAYPHHVGSIIVRPEDNGKIKSAEKIGKINLFNCRIWQQL